MKKKDRFQNIILVSVLVIGLSLLLYPTVSDWWNSMAQSKAVSDYMEQLGTVDNEEYQRMWDEAVAYNESLLDRMNPYGLTPELELQYWDLLDVTGKDIMGYIEIPAIHVSLPVYHGTDDTVLQMAIGHLDWTSLPTGGASTHCVFSGHRGLPSARLFTDLDDLILGDVIVMHIMDETLTYEVDQIKIVEPHESEDLLIQEGKDLLTLVTCTPYGVNSHRLLVRGHRIENIRDLSNVRVTADAVIVDKLIVAPFLLVPMLIVVLVVFLIPSGNSNKNRRNDK